MNQFTSASITPNTLYETVQNIHKQVMHDLVNAPWGWTDDPLATFDKEFSVAWIDPCQYMVSSSSMHLLDMEHQRQLDEAIEHFKNMHVAVPFEGDPHRN